MKQLNKEAMLSKYQASFTELAQSGDISPVASMDAVTIKQVADYLGVSVKEVQTLRQRYKKELDILGMYTLTAREVGASVEGAVHHSGGEYDLPLEDGGVTSIPCGRYTYFNAPAVKRIAEAVQAAPQADVQVCIAADEKAVAPQEHIEHIPSGAGMVRVDLSGDKPAVSARELHEFLEVKSDFSHWFSRMCEYGFSEGQDFTSFLTETPNPCTGRPAMDAAVSIDMAKEICMLQRNEKGKQARQYFLQLERDWNSPEQVMARAIKLADKKIQCLEGKVNELEENNNNLSISNDMLSKKKREWKPRKVVNRLINLYSCVVFGNNFQLGWADFHRELQYKLNMNLKLRAGSGKLLDRVKEDEWDDVVAVAAAMCQSNGIEPARAMNESNAEVYLEARLNAVQ